MVFGRKIQKVRQGSVKGITDFENQAFRVGIIRGEKFQKGGRSLTKNFDIIVPKSQGGFLARVPREKGLALLKDFQTGVQSGSRGQAFDATIPKNVFFSLKGAKALRFKK